MTRRSSAQETLDIFHGNSIMDLILLTWCSLLVTGFESRTVGLSNVNPND
jgi:hypothetical protein